MLSRPDTFATLHSLHAFVYSIDGIWHMLGMRKGKPCRREKEKH